MLTKHCSCLRAKVYFPKNAVKVYGNNSVCDIRFTMGGKYAHTKGTLSKQIMVMIMKTMMRRREKTMMMIKSYDDDDDEDEEKDDDEG